jgi:hypothetical protein
MENDQHLHDACSAARFYSVLERVVRCTSLTLQSILLSIDDECLSRISTHSVLCSRSFDFEYTGETKQILLIQHP